MKHSRCCVLPQSSLTSHWLLPGPETRMQVFPWQTVWVVGMEETEEREEERDEVGRQSALHSSMEENSISHIEHTVRAIH
ncbi:hypothetical protein HYS30_01945 [Candidatus Peregrinibacteria bacterium]|nr:hypothetical protein [Candidatus Peregrinibacteria bacterium]